MPNFIRIVFYKSSAISATISSQIYLSDRQKDIIDLIKQNPKISYRKMAEILDIADSAVKEHLEKLKKLRVIERVGGTREYWKINL